MDPKTRQNLSALWQHPFVVYVKIEIVLSEKQEMDLHFSAHSNKKIFAIYHLRSIQLVGDSAGGACWQFSAFSYM